MEDIVNQTGAAVVFPYYTPAPEQQYPVQLEQIFGVLEYVIDNSQRLKLDSHRFGLAGDSVGGESTSLSSESQRSTKKVDSNRLYRPVGDSVGPDD